jgi:hypothetical protein
VIFGITIVGYGFKEPSPPGPCNFIESSHALSMDTPVEAGRDFVNKSVGFAQNSICKTFISPLFWSSWGQKNILAICFIILLFT